jgi:hypothetical protein
MSASILLEGMINNNRLTGESQGGQTLNVLHEVSFMCFISLAA